MNLREKRGGSILYTDYYRKYAGVLIRAALDLQPGEVLVINAAPWDCEFVRTVTETAYEAGAAYVRCDYVDPEEDRQRCLHSREEYLDYYPEWVTDYMCSYAEQGVAILDLLPPVFGAADSVLTEKLASVRKLRARSGDRYNKARSAKGVTWVKSSLPSVGWAETVYPGLKGEEAVQKLWEALIPILRLDREDPVQAWQEHKRGLQEKKTALDAMNLRKLRFEGPGTELTVELAENSGWTGGCDMNKRTGREYIPNIPTEELFAAPHKHRINGTVAATMPLNYNGSLIEGMRLVIKDGRVVEYGADSGLEALKGILETDEGSRYFGETALVAVTSPIYQTGTIYYNTILDENAVCHMALGRALTSGVPGASSMTEEELENAGLNQCSIHVDFMIGSEELKVTAEDGNGTSVVLMERGTWKI
ncbi:aminopeptidase [uncultured Clostridium sp.]|uniref:aminopeptidase n=1 Tax=uncultured Clostridium sp. TaxID=59620 RepID=UPI003459400F